MKSPIRAILAAAMLAVPAGGAAAATFDFNAMADAYAGANGGTEATYAQMVAFNSGYFSDDGVSITDMAGSDASQHAFFDSGNAGAGVCSSGFIGMSMNSQCSSVIGNNTGDDNVTSGETLNITFDQKVSLTDLFFRNAGHPPLTGSLDINGTSVAVTNGVLGAGVLASLGASTTWAFAYTGDEFYLSTASVSAVPVPAGLLLMGTALGGLGLMRRRRKAA